MLLRQYAFAVFLATLISLIPFPAMSDTPPKPDAPVIMAGPLPNPLVMASGTPVTDAKMWREQRRPELLRLFDDNIYGRTLVARPARLRFVVRDEKKDARGGRATRLRIGVLFEGREDGRQMELLVCLPNGVKGPVPLFLGLNFDGNFDTTEETDIPLPTHWINGLFQPASDHKAHEEARGRHRAMFPYDLVLERGYGIATAGYALFRG